MWKQTDLLRRPTGLAVGLARKEPAPPPRERWVSPENVVPPLPWRLQALGIRRFGYLERRQCRRSPVACSQKTNILSPFAFGTQIPVGHPAASLRSGMELAGRTALLTGATGGLGRAIAKALAARGASVALSARKAEALAALAAELPGEGHRVLVADLAEPGAAERLAAEAGEVDVLVANAGLPAAGLLTDFTPEQVTRALRVNLEAPMLMARALFPAMVERGSGHLVFVSSLSGKAASPRSAIYNATKFGLRGFALGLRTDLGPEGVGVSLVSPGFIREAGMFAEVGAKPPPGWAPARPRQVGAAVVKAIEQDKVELAVAPLPQRALSPLRPCQPRASRYACRAALPARRPRRPSPTATPRTSARKSGRRSRLQAVETGSLLGWRDEQRFLRRAVEPPGGGREYEVFRLDALQERFDVARLPYSIKVLLENVLRTRGRRLGHRADVEALASWDAGGRAERRDRLHAGAGADAGLHRRARRSSTWRRCATRWRRSAATRRRSTRCVAVDLVIDHSVQVDAFGSAARLRASTPSASTSATASATLPALGPAAPSTTSAWCRRHRDLPPGQPRVPRPGRLRDARRTAAARLPRHPGRHRLAHHDGQRPRRARLGRRRDRGRGGDAGPADLDAAAAGGRLQARRRAAARARPPPTSCSP